MTAVPGITVGHATDEAGLTGCTVVLCESGAVGGVDQRGGAPGTRETDLLRPMHLVQRVMRSCWPVAVRSAWPRPTARCATWPSAGSATRRGRSRCPSCRPRSCSIWAIGSSDAWPDAEMGYRACLAASDAPVAQGNVGAGTGCSAGKVLGAGTPPRPASAARRLSSAAGWLSPR